MMFTVEHMKGLLERNLATELEKVKANIIAKIKQFPFSSLKKLYKYLTVLKSVCRDLLVERPIPDGCFRKAIALRQDCHIVFY